ncbi:MAG: AAA family ATPase, partial [Spirochaetia bacterium]|nr:AAA family ATPase [Spirochaetia bacterium]
MSPEEEEKLETLNAVFSPSAPILSRDFFYGRYQELKKVEDAIREKGQHVVLYGERGVGKTSFANIVDREMGATLTAKVTVNRNSTFSELWTELLRKAERAMARDSKDQMHFQDREFLKTKLDSHSLIDYLEKIDKPILFIFDEFDSLTKKPVMSLFADTIKSVSDNLPHISLLFVGIAGSVNELIGEHPSLERCLRQIRVPRMSDEELGEIIDKGMSRLKMSMDKTVRSDIIAFSQGFPHYTHLLAKYSALNAIKLHYNYVARNNFDAAISDAIDNAHESIRDSYQKAVLTSKEKSFYNEVVYACALVEEDEH